MKNKLSDLNDHLFAQLERLANEELTSEQIDAEVRRTDAVVAIADQIVGNAELALKAAKLYADHGEKILNMLPQIGERK